MIRKPISFAFGTVSELLFPVLRAPKMSLFRLRLHCSLHVELVLRVLFPRAVRVGDEPGALPSVRGLCWVQGCWAAGSHAAVRHQGFQGVRRVRTVK